ncbi:MAG TPA: hypothetical protein VFW92_05995 [Candidatus Limnocylindrales bacterium]|nr:hypothetical protein [Candidatus Limnocylindrales bacterium]
MTMQEDLLVQAIEADHRREERAIARVRALPRRVRSAAHRDGPVAKVRRAVGHGLIALGLRVAAVRPARGRSVAAG